MLTFLAVKGFAIIDEILVEFGEGLNVITGETGAGKSIIVNALSNLMKVKTPADVVRTNADRAEVTGHFHSGDQEHILMRIINASGRSRAFMDDDPVPANKLAEIGDSLISIYGQNEFHYLLDKERYVGILDNLLGLENLRMALGEKVQSLRRCEAELEAKRKEAEGREKEIALLEFQVEEIDRERIKEGEEEQLKERIKILKDAEKIRTSLGIIEEGLCEGEYSAYLGCKKAVGLLKPFTGIEAVEQLRTRIETLFFDIEDLSCQIHDIEKSLSHDPEELQTLEERLLRLYDLKSKYGRTCEDIRRYEESANKRLGYLKTLSTDIGDLEKKRADLGGEVGVLAENLSAERSRRAGPVEKAVVEELGFLSMKGIAFHIAVTKKENIDETGMDDVELMISTNPGEPLKPLRKIASGGELSRIMLAVKRVIGGDEGKTLVFDEVDAGIGGRVADLVGRRLRDLAARNQVVCITHLPQIASYGDHHFLVEKVFDGGATKTNIRKLSSRERVEELARMLGGATITEKSLERAEEMIDHVEKSLHTGC